LTKCEGLQQTDANLVQVVQDRKKGMSYTGGLSGIKEFIFGDGTSSKPVHINKKAKGKCSCNRKIVCPKINACKHKSVYEDAPIGSAYRVTPVCFVIHKLNKE
jgi:hypothetical protein